jgi:hypothetical protein
MIFVGSVAASAPGSGGRLDHFVSSENRERP